MRKIENLTAEQEVLLAEFRQKWLDIGLCYEPANFSLAEEQIAYFYNLIGKKKPMFFRFSSPMMCELGTAAIKIILGNNNQLLGQLRNQLGNQLGGQLGDQLRNQLGNQLGGQLVDQLGDQLRNQLGGQLVDQLGDQLRNQLVDQLGDQLRNQLGDQLVDQLGDQLGGQLRNQLGDQLLGQLRNQLWDQLEKTEFCNSCFVGQHESAWIAFYKFGLEIGAKYRDDDIKLLNAWGAIAESACWWSPWENICIISDRPRFVSFDTQKRLHNETRKACEFSDGWGLYAWHGTRIPEDIILNPSSITVDRIDKETNVEVKRAMIANYIGGQAKWLKDSGATLIHECPDVNSGLPLRLWRKERKNDTPFVMVEMLNKTKEKDDDGQWRNKSYFIRVKPDITDAMTACAWHHNQSKEDYLLTQTGT